MHVDTMAEFHKLIQGEKDMGITIVPRATPGDETKQKPTIDKDIAKIVEKFNEFFEEVGTLFVDRDKEIEKIRLAFATREHVLLKGKPGTAKSLLARVIFAAIAGSDVFSIMLTKFMSEDYLFGPINVKKLREDGEIVHNTKGSIVDANFAFLDEFFDGSDPLLRSMLEVLNERTFTRSGKSQKCPLHTAILTSNYTREEEATEAILDRILFKVDVEAISDDEGRLKMYKGHLSQQKISTTGGLKLSELTELADYIHSTKVTISDSVLTTYDKVIRDYMRQTQAFISDRSCNKMLSVLKASAVLAGRNTVTADDIEALRHCVVTSKDPRSEQIFETVFQKTVLEGRKAQAELVDIFKCRDKVKDLIDSKESKDAEKDAIIKIRGLQDIAKDDLRILKTKVTTPEGRAELELVIEAVDAGIVGLKEVWNK